MTLENEQGKFASDGFSRLAGILENGASFSVESTRDADGRANFNALLFLVRQSDGSQDHGVIKL